MNTKILIIIALIVLLMNVMMKKERFNQTSNNLQKYNKINGFASSIVAMHSNQLKSHGINDGKYDLKTANNKCLKNSKCVGFMRFKDTEWSTNTKFLRNDLNIDSDTNNIEYEKTRHKTVRKIVAFFSVLLPSIFRISDF